MAASLISAAIGAGTSLWGAKKASDAAKDAAAAQRAGIQKGISSSQPYYETAQNYLSPYVQAGTDSLTLINDIIGMNGPEAQQRALQMYQSSPSANILKQVQEEALRQTAGKFAAQGGYKSGSMIEDLSRRQSDIALGDYRNWEDLSRGVFNTGANAAAGAANLASRRGADLIGAYTDIGTTNASGIAGNAGGQIAGMAGVNNYLQDFLNRQSGSNDFSSLFKSPATSTISSQSSSIASALPRYASNSTFDLNSLTKLFRG